LQHSTELISISKKDSSHQRTIKINLQKGAGHFNEPAP